MASTWRLAAEPGFILIDRVNEMNNNWFWSSSAPPIPVASSRCRRYGSCLLGSGSTSPALSNSRSPNTPVLTGALARVVAIFTRMLDNVVEIKRPAAGGPTRGNYQQAAPWHGLFWAWAHALAMLRLKYGSARRYSSPSALPGTGIDMAHRAATGGRTRRGAGPGRYRHRGYAGATARDARASGESR